MDRDDVGKANATSPGPRVVLLRDQSWPQVPGVCCWRQGVHEAFAAVGARVDDVVIRPPLVKELAGGSGRSAPRMAWLPRPVRAPLVLAYRGSRSTMRGLERGASALGARARSTRRHQRQVLAALGGAALVIAESPGVAVAAVSAGIAPRSVWSLALPPERLSSGDSSGYAGQLAGITPGIGGFLTDSELARESVERATAAARPRIEIFPPLTIDRPCRSCAGSPPPHQRAEAADDFPSEVAQLVLWRSMIDQMRAGGLAEAPYSFPAARLCGLSARWVPARRLDWTQETATSVLRGPDDSSPAEWSFDTQVRAARAVLDAVTPRGPATRRAPRATLVVGFDLKFVRELAARLDIRTDLDITIDDWPALGTGTGRSEALVGRAESILAEWARPSAVWVSKRKRPDQFLVVRLHRYELDCPYPRDIAIDNVDAVVHVSPPIGRRIRDELGWPVEKLVYIPNFLDADWLDRPKLPDARFGIGFVGLEWARKRLDLALDVLTEARRHDPRFTLFVRSVMPWDNTYAWRRPEEREYVGWCMERIEQDSFLRGAVIFDPPGGDMARWYRRVGHVLSMSDDESFHLAAAEGMASGAVPVIRPWPGAAEIYDKEWIHSSVDDAAAAVLASVDPDAWAERAARAKAEIRRTADPAAVVHAWAALLHGDVARARSCFGELASRTGRHGAEHSSI